MLDREVQKEANELQLPGLVTKLLTKKYPQAKISNIQIESFGSNGENFCSDVYRVKAKVSEENSKSFEAPLVVKIMREECMIDNVTTEGIMYEDGYLETIETIVKDLGFEHSKFSPRFYGRDMIPSEVFVMEDLKALGYVPGNRFTGLDFEEAKLAMGKIGQYHAASMILLEKDPSIIEKLGPSGFSEGIKDAIGSVITFGMLDHAHKIIGEWEDFEEIASKIKNSIGTFNKRVTEIMDMSKFKVLVINHGDFWINNFLINHQTNDVILVDFQDSHIGSPAFDLQRFLNTSIKLEVLQKNRYDLIRHYYKSFKEVLLKANYSRIPSYQTILDEIRNLEFLGYHAAISELPFCCISMKPGEVFDSSTFLDPVEMEHRRVLMYENPRVLELLRYALDRFDEMGILD